MEMAREMVADMDLEMANSLDMERIITKYE
jgi:hypothetical protein